jgi:N-formylglutamate deformylase
MSKLILHVPHAGTTIPDRTGYVVSEEVLQSEQLLLTDWYTDDLFDHGIGQMIRADFSRVFCDPERFVDDHLEVMSQVGMGVLYELRDNGERMRIVSPLQKQEIIARFYQPHHDKLNSAIDIALDELGEVCILDCHSFSDQPFQRDLSKITPRPDFNIGTDAFHTPKDLLEKAEYFLVNRGYSVGIDWPYSGALVPMNHYKKNINVKAIMLEINRKLYLEPESNEKSKDYERIRSLIHDFQVFLLQE